MGRKRSVDYSPKEFEKLSTEERRMRGRLSTIKRMIKKREDDIDELMKPILKKKEEIKKFSEELDGLKNSIKDLGFDFPTFRVEPFTTKGRDYYRGVWYVNGTAKHKQAEAREPCARIAKTRTHLAGRRRPADVARVPAPHRARAGCARAGAEPRDADGRNGRAVARYPL